MYQLDIVPQFITLDKTPSQSFDIVLENHNCNVKFSCINGYTYNWLTVDNIVVNAGVMCHCNLKFNQYQPQIFKGTLMFLNVSQDGSEPYYTEFNNKYKLIFLNEEQTELLGG